ncbi:ArsR family transcriptional regulator [Streptomyces eurocidicus]|uniref:ArsR family transcriptional regulator n=1 Tax=Streptomyces eurocidicus TaxID=66423 RepID=A0A2N8NWR1_STREU|nr:helix-turn-helix domain-containing protein [Streptomyces eurocidicus]MBB5117993.1 DNA-binding transcriptional ArsR family regulator [Streptomyces eurocidicus]MBF6053972.1 helix-turn-helix domain-containing protein [Streptomyces eurocidicus]PNE33207.1 ArsR family transcriptional regulator [Streptomyces eurocidicus]
MATYHPDRDQLLIEDVLAALGHPVRLGIVRELAASEGERTCGSLPVEVTKATATFHWRVLRESGITRERKAGRYKAVELRRADLDTRFPGLLDAVLNATPPADGASAGSAS